MKNREDAVKVKEKPIVVKKRSCYGRFWIFREPSSCRDLILFAAALAIAIWTFFIIFPFLVIVGIAYIIYRFLKKKRWLN